MADKKKPQTDKAPAKKDAAQGTELLLEAKTKGKRVPLLESVYNNFARLAALDLHSLMSGSHIDVSYERMSSEHFDKHFAPLLEKDPHMLGPFKIAEWGDGGLFLCDLPMLTASVKRMLGVSLKEKTEDSAEKKDVREHADGLTAIEQHLGTKIFRVLTAAFAKAFNQVESVTMLFEHTELRSKADFYLYPTLCAIGHFRLSIEEETYPFYLALPYTTIQPVRALLSRDYLGEKMGKDQLWKEHLDSELTDVGVNIKAVLAETTMPLHAILNWQKGQVFLLYKTPESGIDIVCDGKKVFIGKMGRQKNTLAFSITHSFLNKKGATE